MISWLLTFQSWDKQVWQSTFSSSSAVDLLSIFWLVKQKIKRPDDSFASVWLERMRISFLENIHTRKFIHFYFSKEFKK